MPAVPDPKRDEPVKLPGDPEDILRALLAVRMDDPLSPDAAAVGEFIAENPELVPTLYAMVAAASESDIGEFSRDWIAERELTVPRTFQAFEKAGLIGKSPRGMGSRRNFYVFTNLEAVERALAESQGPEE